MSNLVADFTQDDIDELLPLISNSHHAIPEPGCLQKVLQRFGVEKLRPAQERAINAVLSENDVFLCLPTGGGKSLCYQTPSLLFGRNVAILNAKGIACGLINSTVSAGISANLRSDVLKDASGRILYVTPESFQNELVLDLLLKLYEMARIDLFAIDEAHCISTWGHYFRPSYRNLSIIRSTFKSVPILACTATATKLVANDIMSTLSMKSPIVIKSSFNRPNIYYKIVWSLSLIQNEQQELLQFLKNLRHGRGGIIYCMTKACCCDLSEFLSRSGILVGVYHAGLPIRERERVQSAWETSEIDIVIATVAFGMGIHREDVSFIVHMNLPKSIENYYQETGRAGRNGKPAVAILFYSRQDEHRLKHLLGREGVRNSNVLKLAEDMIKLCKEPKCHRQKILAYFGEEWKPSSEPNCCNFCDNPALFQQAPSKQSSNSSMRSILAFTGKRKLKQNAAMNSSISLIDLTSEDEDTSGIYHSQPTYASSVTSKRKKPLRVEITDVQRSLCRRRIFSAVKQNRLAADSKEDECLLNAFSQTLEQSLFTSSCAKSEYMDKTRKVIVAIQSASNALCLYDETVRVPPTLDLKLAQTRLRRVDSMMSELKEIPDFEELELLINALTKYSMTLDELRSIGIGRDLNALIKTLKSANFHLTHMKLFSDFTLLLSRWKDLLRQDSNASQS